MHRSPLAADAGCQVYFLYSGKYFSAGSIPLVVNKASSSACWLGSEARSRTLRMAILLGPPGPKQPCVHLPRSAPSNHCPSSPLPPGTRERMLKTEVLPRTTVLSVLFSPVVLPAWHHVQRTGFSPGCRDERPGALSVQAPFQWPKQRPKWLGLEENQGVFTRL